ncbi:exosome complex exonuclease RRP40 [Zalerion maritima]|uniref:Ribosomal RNA-processing protein 40 n=1 Tax=Zalerion maritima TaxID=339359 RepID=A0AAD5RRA6_9PEZI|nr:exosome complex exonuclease RRP40 [Zalerion maritima]
MAEEGLFVLPGDLIDPSFIPSHPKKPLRLGPGLRHIPPNSILPTVSGQVYTDNRKNSIWVEYNGGRYVPSTNDQVIGQIQRSAGEHYYVNIAPYASNAVLPHLAFEGVTKKTRPQLNPGALVYARVALAHKHMDVELECVSPSTGKADGLGPLVDGMVFNVSLGLARRLSMSKKENSKVIVLDLLGDAGLVFEVVVGRNGRVWIGGGSVADTVLVGRALTQTDEEDHGPEAQKNVVRRLLSERK